MHLKRFKKRKVERKEKRRKSIQEIRLFLNQRNRMKLREIQNKN